MASRRPSPFRPLRPLLVALALGLMAWALAGEARPVVPVAAGPVHGAGSGAIHEAPRP